MRSIATRALAKAMLTPWRFAFGIASVMVCMGSAFALLVSLHGADVRLRQAEGVAGRPLWTLERAPLSHLDLLREVPGTLPEAVVRRLEQASIPAWFVLARSAAIADADGSFSLEATVNAIVDSRHDCWVGHLPTAVERGALHTVWVADVLPCVRGGIPPAWRVIGRLLPSEPQLLMSTRQVEAWWARDWRPEVRRAYFAPVDAEEVAWMKALPCCVVRQVTLTTASTGRRASNWLTWALLATLALVTGLGINGQRELIRLETSLKRVAGLRWRLIARSVMQDSLAVSLLPWLAGAAFCVIWALANAGGVLLGVLAPWLLQTGLATVAGSSIWAFTLLMRCRQQAIQGLLKS